MNKFAFIGHPIDLEHLYSLLGNWGWLAQKMPRHVLYSLLLKVPPFKYGEITALRSKTGSIASGIVVICPFLPQQVAFLKEDEVIEKVVQAVKLSEKLGAKMAVLGGFTSIVGNEGEIVSKRVKIAVTSGNTYTACLAIEGIEKATKIMELNLASATLALIGATGDIGSACARFFSKKVKKMNIVARNEKRLNDFADFLCEHSSCDVKVFMRAREAVKEADVILTVTSAISVLVNPDDLKPGAIVCDVAIPANIAKEIVKIRNDILAFEGGLARPPFMDDIENSQWRRATPPNSIFGCLSEGLLLALDGRFENYSIGRGNITEAKIKEMFEIEKRHGFEVAQFFCGDKLFTEKDICNIRRNAERNKERLHAAQR